MMMGASMWPQPSPGPSPSPTPNPNPNPNQATASEVALSSKASERQQLLKSAYRTEARLLAAMESPVEIARAPSQIAGAPSQIAAHAGASTERRLAAGGAADWTAGGEGGATEQGILSAATTAISPSLESSNGR